MTKSKSRAIVIEDSVDSKVYNNTIVGYEEGIVVINSERTDAKGNTVVSKESEGVISQIQTFINVLNVNLEKLELNDEKIKEIESDINTILSQINSPKPKAGILSSCFESVRSVLENAAGSVIAGELLSKINDISYSLAN